MISKPKKCIECGREDLPHFSHKRCIYCARKSYNKVKSTPKIKDNSELDTYYSELIKESELSPYSFETGQYIKRVERKNICHLFPKRAYESVKSNKDNFVLLTFEEHTRFDNLLDKFNFDKLKEEFPKSFKKLMQFALDYEEILEHKKLKVELLKYNN